MYNIRIRRDIRSNFEEANPYLGLGEITIIENEFPTPVRIGDGHSQWSELTEQYFSLLTGEELQTLLDFYNSVIARLQDSEHYNLDDSEGVNLYSHVDKALDSEMKLRIKADAELKNLIRINKYLQLQVNTEVANKLDSLTALLESLNETFTEALDTESRERQQADQSLQVSIEVLDELINQISSALSTEVEQRKAADESLQKNIDNVDSALSSEQEFRLIAEEQLRQSISSEATTREQVDTSLQNNIDYLQSQIDNIEVGSGWRLLLDSTGAELYDSNGYRLGCIFNPAISAEATIRALEDQRTRIYCDYQITIRTASFADDISALQGQVATLFNEYSELFDAIQVQSTRIDDLEDLVNTFDSRITDLATALENEIIDRKSDVAVLQRITNELRHDLESLSSQVATDHQILFEVQERIQSISESLSSEILARQQADQHLQSQISYHSIDIENLQTGLAAEEQARINAVNRIDLTLGNLADTIAQEVSDRQGADTELQNQITPLQEEVAELEKYLPYLVVSLVDSTGKFLLDSEGNYLLGFVNPAVDAEAAVRKTEDDSIKKQIAALADLRLLPVLIDNEIDARRQGDLELHNEILAKFDEAVQLISEESQARQQADQTLQESITELSDSLDETNRRLSTEATNRVKADAELRGLISDLSDNLAATELSLQHNIDEEVSARQQTDENVQALDDRVSLIESNTYALAFDSEEYQLIDTAGAPLAVQICPAVDSEATIRAYQDSLIKSQINELGDFTNLANQLDQERSDRAAADQELLDSINSTRDTLENIISLEQQARESADERLQDDIDSNANAIQALSDNLRTETYQRVQEDLNESRTRAQQDALEAQARQQADQNLSNEIQSLSTSLDGRIAANAEAIAQETEARIEKQTQIEGQIQALDDRVSFVEPMVYSTAYDSEYHLLLDSDGNTIIIPVSTALDVEIAIRDAQYQSLLARIERLEQIISNSF